MGLVGQSFWMTHEQVITSDAESGVPLAKLTVLGGNTDDESVVLAHQLASEEQLSEVRALWVRAPGDDRDEIAAMSRAEASIRRLIPQDGVRLAFVDVLVPQTLADLQVPHPPPDWQQFVVEPRDRPNPEASDSFYDPETAPLQGLHAALIIGGILGGNNNETPAPRIARNDLPWIVHPFSRVISGGDAVRRHTEHVLHEELGTLTAADVAPAQFLEPEPEEVSGVIDVTVGWIRSLDDEALTFHRPSIALEVRGQSFLNFLRSVFDFTIWALRGMFGPGRWRDLYLSIRSRFARSLEADDYGAVIDLGAPTPQGLHLRDWDAEAVRAREAGEVAVAAARDADGALVHAEVWKSLTKLVASLIDGSTPPSGWVPRERFGRKYSLGLLSMVRSEAAESTATEVMKTHDFVLSPEMNSELSRVKQIGASELTRAVNLVAENLKTALVRFSGPTSRVSRTAQTVIEQGINDESSDRTAIAESLTFPPSDPADDSLPLLSRLRAHVVSDLVLARVAVGLLSSLSEPAIPRRLEEMRSALRGATWIVLIVALVGGGSIALLAQFSANIDALLATFQVPFPRSYLDIIGTVVAVMITVLLPTFIRLFYLFRAYNEIGSRSLEYTEKRAAAQVHTLNELSRLRNAERILGLWEQILSEIRSPRPAVGPEEPLPTELLPDALRIAEPDIENDELQLLVIDEAIDIGWFASALKEVLNHSLNQKDLDLLWRDEGLAGGELVTARDVAVDGVVQREWWRAWVTGGVRGVTTRLDSEERDARVYGAPSATVKTIRAFRSEILRDLDAEYRPGSDYEERFDTREKPQRMVAAASPGGVDYRTTPALVSVDTALIMRRIARLGKTTTKSTATSNSDDTIGRV